MFRRSTSPAAVRRHRRARSTPWQWLAAPARRAAVLAVSGALALVGLTVAVATVGTPDHGTTQAEGSTTPDATSSGDPAPTTSASSATASETADPGSASASPVAGTPAARSTPSAGLSLTHLTQLTSSAVPTLTGSPSDATGQPTQSSGPQAPITSTLSSPLPTLTPGKPPGSSLHPSPGHGATHATDKQ